MSFIAVIGRSGTGKTTIINALIHGYPQKYQRASSFTTREKREGEGSEYQFVSESDMNSMLANGRIRYIDEAFGYKYAMSCEVFSKQDYDFIKEIHPSNIFKIRENTEDVIVIKIISDELTGDRHRRDLFNYADYPADILFDYNPLISLRETAKDLDRKIEAFKLQKKLLIPAPRVIDQTNAKGYNLIAPEFTEEKRITTANFHSASKIFFVNSFRKVKDRSNILELGSGNGWLSSICGYNFSSLDISDKMRSPGMKRVLSVSHIPDDSNKYDAIFASLCDPFFYPIAIAEIIRILKRGGQCYCSIPSYTWAKISRNNERRTTFLNSKGEKSEVYSFIFNCEEICDMGKILGFDIEEFSSYHVDANEKVISPAIINPCKINSLDPMRLKIVDCYVLRKV